MAVKEQLQQMVDAMSDEEAVRVLQLLSWGEGEDSTVGVEGAGGARKGGVVRRRIRLDALARELGRFKRRR